MWDQGLGLGLVRDCEEWNGMDVGSIEFIRFIGL